jgi:hypothetical protein
MTTWLFHHSDDFVTRSAPTDARGLRLRADAGYTFVNRGNGFEQISYILPRIEVAEQIAANMEHQS